MSDLLFRGRGADVGVRAPGWLVRIAGAALGLGLYAVGDLLGFRDAIGTDPDVTRLVLIVAGAIVAPTRAGALLWVPLVALLAIMLLATYTPIVSPVARAFVRADPPGGRVDAVVVLSGGMTLEGRLTGQAIDRLLTGATAARRLGVRSLGLSVIREGRNGTTTSEADQRALVALTLPEADARFVRDVFSTRDEALAFAALARTHGWQRVLLVTSPLHTRRACRAVEAAGLAVQCLPAEARDYALSRLSEPENRRRVFADALYESAATLLYSLRGWTR